jgi:cation diffusion facilitator CzcD-associated flavoprotein CzcO
MSDAKPVDALVVGAGLAGLYGLHLLRGLGFRTRVVEAGDGVGGTWFWNRYPGARCDVESHFYSYSFDPDLAQEWEWEWTEKYPTQPEILRYIGHVADRHDLRRDITLRTRVTAATYDEDAQRWTVETDTGETIDTRFLIMATGCLSSPKAPEIPGLERFAGPIHHTSRWPHEGVDFTGLRVGVIGTGSSGVQSIPVIARQASDVTVFQRTPNFAFPARNRPLEEREVEAVKGTYREWRAIQRTSPAGVPGEPPTMGALEATDDERAARYEAAWEEGTIGAMITSYTDTLVNKASNDTLADFIRGKIRAIVDDPEVAEILCPTSHPVGTKRPLLDSGYYATFNEEHVHLVDLRSTPLLEITERGIRTTEAEYAFDAIVLATGFDAMTGALLAIDITGTGGRTLRAAWAEGPDAYLGIGVAGFPNLFTITGPTSPSVLSNMIVSIEQHVEWVADCIAHLRDEGIAAIEPTPEAQEAWARHAEEVGNATLYPTADSWYMGANVPGKPRVFMPYIGGVGAYRERCDEVAANGYEGFTLVPAGARYAAAPTKEESS